MQNPYKHKARNYRLIRQLTLTRVPLLISMLLLSGCQLQGGSSSNTVQVQQPAVYVNAPPIQTTAPSNLSEDQIFINTEKNKCITKGHTWNNSNYECYDTPFKALVSFITTCTSDATCKLLEIMLTKHSNLLGNRSMKGLFSGFTPLMYAAVLDRPMAITILLNAAKDSKESVLTNTVTNSETRKTTFDGLTALMLAIVYEKKQAVDAILKNSGRFKNSILEQKSLPNKNSAYAGKTPLGIAQMIKDSAITQILSDNIK